MDKNVPSAFQNGSAVFSFLQILKKKKNSGFSHLEYLIPCLTVANCYFLIADFL